MSCPTIGGAELKRSIGFIACFGPSMKDDATYQTFLSISVLVKSKLVISGIVGNLDVLVFCDTAIIMKAPENLDKRIIVVRLTFADQFFDFG